MRNDDTADTSAQLQEHFGTEVVLVSVAENDAIDKIWQVGEREGGLSFIPFPGRRRVDENREVGALDEHRRMPKVSYPNTAAIVLWRVSRRWLGREEIFKAGFLPVVVAESARNFPERTRPKPHGGESVDPWIRIWDVDNYLPVPLQAWGAHEEGPLACRGRMQIDLLYSRIVQTAVVEQLFEDPYLWMAVKVIDELKEAGEGLGQTLVEFIQTEALGLPLDGPVKFPKLLGK